MTTITDIKTMLGSDAKWATRAIVRLFELQTADEQMAEVTAVHNGQGFNGTDAKILSSFAKQVLAGRTLSPKQLNIAFKKLPKYAGQLMKVGK
jgi:hypothetical protein